MIIILYLLITLFSTIYQDNINQLSLWHIILINCVLWYTNAFFYYFLDILHKRYPLFMTVDLKITKQYDVREKKTFQDMFMTSNINLVINYILVLCTLLITQKGINRESTNIIIILLEYLSYYVIHEVIFYWLHRLIHTSYFYRIHKLHHTTYGTVAICCFYMSTYDMLLEIFIPFILGPILINGHIVSLFIWSMTGLINTFKEHSGYGIKTHYYHHSTYNKNYSVYLMDKLMGTNYIITYQ